MVSPFGEYRNMNYPDQYKRLEKFITKTDSCWLWTGFINPAGYGQCYFKKRSGHLAHRALYMIFKGEIPKGFELDHLCRVRHCVNPLHLEVVTGKVNTLRGYGLPAQNARKKNCPKCGGKFTQYKYDGYRRCKPCRRKYNAMMMRIRRASPIT